jgi:hypothetical protein
VSDVQGKKVKDHGYYSSSASYTAGCARKLALKVLLATIRNLFEICLTIH